MKITTDVKCYHCGHISGQMEGETGSPITTYTFRPREGYVGKKPARGQRVRCERCNGPVYLEDVRPVREGGPFSVPQPKPQPRIVRPSRRRRVAQRA